LTVTIYVNGKFTCQATTGVQRVAEQLLRALDALAPRSDEPRWVLLHPPGGGLAGLRRIEQRAVGPARAPLHAWEQAWLPRAAVGGLLLNLSGSAPYLGGRTAAMLHDAAVFDHPEAYSSSFVAWYRRLFARLGRRAERLFTVSAFSRSRLAACLGLPESRFEVLANAADHLDRIEPDDSVLDRHGLRARPFLLAVGSANPTKNLPTLVQAFGRLAPGDLRLVIVGGSNARVFADDGSAAGDPPGVVRTGPLGDAPLKALYRHALGLVFPSLYEGFGLPALEAMAQGCAVAASNVASMPEVCGDAALYFDPRTAAGISAAIERLVGDAGLREDLRRAGLARAAKFSWAASAGRLRAVLCEGEARR
jgi:glycosyltransferase involved in cell wall biosynthesis